MLGFVKTGKIGVTREDVLKQRKRNMAMLYTVLGLIGYGILFLLLHVAAKF